LPEAIQRSNFSFRALLRTQKIADRNQQPLFYQTRQPLSNILCMLCGNFFLPRTEGRLPTFHKISAGIFFEIIDKKGKKLYYK
jgi:hypothetical protein